MNIKNLLFVAIAMLLFVGCSDDDDSPNVNDKELTESTWSETMAGRDEVLGQYPDRYSNYWEYTWNIDEAQDVALKMEGEFPYTRYCSFSLYNDNTGEAIGGINDYEMVPTTVRRIRLWLQPPKGAALRCISYPRRPPRYKRLRWDVRTSSECLPM